MVDCNKSLLCNHAFMTTMSEIESSNIICNHDCWQLRYAFLYLLLQPSPLPPSMPTPFCRKVVFPPCYQLNHLTSFCSCASPSFFVYLFQFKEVILMYGCQMEDETGLVVKTPSLKFQQIECSSLMLLRMLQDSWPCSMRTMQLESGKIKGVTFYWTNG